jgi:hypothetical protein
VATLDFSKLASVLFGIEGPHARRLIAVRRG